MIRKFKIINGKYKELEAYLTYDTETDKYSMKILRDYNGKHPDLFFKILNSQGIEEVPEHLVNQWVQGRVIPPDRQGMQGILQDLGMTEYNVFDLLIYGNGKCQMDFSYIEEIN